MPCRPLQASKQASRHKVSFPVIRSDTLSSGATALLSARGRALSEESHLAYLFRATRTALAKRGMPPTICRNS